MASVIVQPEFVLVKVPVYAVDMVKTYGRVPLWKVDEQTHTVYGLSTAELPDSDREVADYVDSAKNYMQWGDETSKRTRDAGQEVSYGNIRLQHTGQIAGAVRRIDLIPEKRSIWLQTQPVDDDIWRQLAGGFLTGYSHAGKYAYRRCFECGNDLPMGHFCPQCHKEQLVRYAPILTEVSYVDRPCLKDAVFAYVKADGSTEMRTFVAPQAKKVLVDIRELATQHAAAFMQAIEDLGKQARTEVGQFSNNVSGPEHDALLSGGFEHKTTCENGACVYQHPGGAKVTLGSDGAWEHDDGAGRISSGVGSQAIAIHLAACNKAAADSAGEDTTTMKDEDVKKLVKDGITDIFSALGVKFVDGEVVPVDLPANKASKKDMIECPGCGEDIDVDPEDGEDSVECPECGRKVSIKTAKAVKMVMVALALRKDMSHIGRLADILQAIRYLQQYVIWEGESEKDARDFAIAENLGGLLNDGVDILNQLVADETSELTQPFAIPALKTAALNNKENTSMKVEELLNKAAQGLKAFFTKTAAFHVNMVTVHKGLADEQTAKMAKATDAEKADVEKQANFHTAVATHHQNLADTCKEAADSFGTETAKAEAPIDLTKALGDTQAALSTAIDAKLEPITKALGALDGIATLGERLGKVEAAVEKFGNETLPTAVKAAGAQLINREGKNLEPPKNQSPSGGLFE